MNSSKNLEKENSLSYLASVGKVNKHDTQGQKLLSLKFKKFDYSEFLSKILPYNKNFIKTIFLKYFK